MTDSRAAPNAGRFEVRATAADHFAWVRTRLALERTMMAWQRTAVALIGFGFAIVQYFNHLQQIPGARSAYLPTAPEYLGLALISCGILALAISLWQYLRTVRYLWSGSFSLLAGMEADLTKEKNTIAGLAGRHPPDLHRPVRLLCRVVPPHLAAGPSNRDQRALSTPPDQRKEIEMAQIQSSSQAEHRRHLGR